MKSLWKLAFLSTLATFGCKTQEQQSAVKDFGDFPQGTAEGFDIATMNSSFWKGEFDAGFPLIITLKVEEQGNGVMSVSADGQTETLEFANVRLATGDELTMARERLGKTFIDSKGAEITYEQAVVLVDENDTLKNIFAVLHTDELMVHPSGPMIRQAESPEADVARCGGMAGLKCPSGFVCQGAVFDKMGSCVKSAPAQMPKGAQGLPMPTKTSAPKCGGFAGFQCPPALVCKINPPHPDGMGICVEPNTPAPTKTKTSTPEPQGPQKCGTIAGLTCPKGQTCKLPKSAPPDASGTCVDKK